MQGINVQIISVKINIQQIAPFEAEGTVYHADTCLPLVDAVKRKKLKFKALARHTYPGDRLTDDTLGLFGPKLGIGKGNNLLPKGVRSGQKITFMFESVSSMRANTSNFDLLPIPYRAIATDIISGNMVVLGSGGLSWST